MERLLLQELICTRDDRVFVEHSGAINIARGFQQKQ